MSQTVRPNRPRGFADALGVFLSQLCLAHCFLLPALLLVIPSLDLHDLPGAGVMHFVLLLLATPTALYALLTGYRFHQRMAALHLGGLGLLLLWLGSAAETWHWLLSHSVAHGLGAVGSLFVIAAHLVNRGFSKRAATSGCCCTAS